MSLLDLFNKLIEEHGSAGILRERLLLVKEQLELLEKEKEDLKKENTELSKEIHKLRKQLEHYEIGKDFVEESGVLFRAVRGKYSHVPYCITCRVPLERHPELTDMPLWCPRCKSRTHFLYSDINGIIQELPPIQV